MSFFFQLKPGGGTKFFVAVWTDCKRGEDDVFRIIGGLDVGNPLSFTQAFTTADAGITYSTISRFWTPSSKVNP